MTSLRREVLISYDVGSNRIRTKLFEILKDFGLVPIQKSVFWGEISKAEEKAIYRHCASCEFAKGDSLLFTYCDISQQLERCIGFDSQQFELKETDCV